jgi:hypothetical protein
MADNRTDAVIETAEAILSLLDRDLTDAPKDPTVKSNADELGGAYAAGIDRARQTVRTYIAAARTMQSPRVGRPRKPKAEGAA